MAQTGLLTCNVLVGSWDPDPPVLPSQCWGYRYEPPTLADPWVLTRFCLFPVVLLTGLLAFLGFNVSSGICLSLRQFCSVAQADLELICVVKVSLKLSAVPLPNDEIAGMCHHAQAYCILCKLLPLNT